MLEGKLLEELVTVRVCSQIVDLAGAWELPVPLLIVSTSKGKVPGLLPTCLLKKSLTVVVQDPVMGEMI